MDVNVLIVAKGLGRYRLEDGTNGFVLNFLNQAALAYHLTKVMRLNKAQQADVWKQLNETGKVRMQLTAVSKAS